MFVRAAQAGGDPRHLQAITEQLQHVHARLGQVNVEQQNINQLLANVANHLVQGIIRLLLSLQTIHIIIHVS